ncbi:MAG: helix-turn-helix transcriptional regulator [Myxococcales bacterium FL481]|nr:MAG: helix-turn-helix transcriptional regulator [Myxococcales bacterium FL481]
MVAAQPVRHAPAIPAMRRAGSPNVTSEPGQKTAPIAASSTPGRKALMTMSRPLISVKYAPRRSQVRCSMLPGCSPEVICTIPSQVSAGHQRDWHPVVMDPSPSPFGQQLKHWRRLRGMSQLDLAHRAEVSPRHVSFVETGRSRPSSDMVLRLADSLDVPLREQNDLLRAAGFGPAFAERELEASDMAGVRRIVRRMLLQHEPFPAFVIDRYWDIVDANAAARRMFPEAGTSPNAIETFLGPGMYRQIVENWADVAWATFARLRREATTSGSDPRLAALLARAETLMADAPAPAKHVHADAPAIATRLRAGDAVISTISTIASFSTARDVTLDELRIELVFPADEAAEAFFAAAASG